MNIEDFSSGYYAASMQVEPYQQGPTISCELFEFINREYYGGTDSEPMFRLDMDGSPYFTTSCEYSIPKDVIGIPEEWFRDSHAERSYDEQMVYILKPSYAYLLDDAMQTGQYPEDIVVDLDGDLDLTDTDFRQNDFDSHVDSEDE